MNKKILLLPSLAGLATLLGNIPTYLNSSKKEKIIGKSLSFSAGIIMSISLFSLIPESYQYLAEQNNFKKGCLVLLYILLGIIISTLIKQRTEKESKKDALYRVGLMNTIALMLHNIPEGIITYLTTKANQQVGLSLTIAIAIHNIPEGIAIAVPIYYSTKSHIKSIFMTLLAGFSELLGAVLTHVLLRKIITKSFLGYILSITAGIMIEITVKELIPSAKKYESKKNILVLFLTGVIMMILLIKFL